MSSDLVESVIVVGGGIGGVSTATALRDRGFDGTITIIEAGGVPYDRPPLSKDYLSGNRSIEQIYLQSPQWYDDAAVELRTDITVTALRPSEGGVELSTGALLRGDRIVLATGGRAARPFMPGADDARVHVVRTSDDADRLRDFLVPGARVQVIGAGLIGAEVASTAVDLGAEVFLADPVSPPLAAAVGPMVAQWLHSQHVPRGISLDNCGVAEISKHTNDLEIVYTADLDSRHVDLVVVGIGMTPATELAETAGLACDGGVIVDTARRTSNPNVLAVGDATRIQDGGVLARRAEHWEAAQLGGAVAAGTLLGEQPPKSPAAWFWSDRHHRHVEVVGSMASADEVTIRGEFGVSPFAVFGTCGERVVAAVSIDDSTAVRAARRLIERQSAVTSDELADTTVDLRALLRASAAR